MLFIQLGTTPARRRARFSFTSRLKPIEERLLRQLNRGRFIYIYIYIYNFEFKIIFVTGTKRFINRKIIRCVSI